MAQDTESAIRDGRYFKTATASRHTLAVTIDRYIREVLPGKPRSAKFQVRQLAWWRAELGRLTLADVTASVIAEARAALLSTPGTDQRARGPATANRYIAVLSHVLSVATREWEWLEANPARKLRKLNEPRGRDRFLSEDECDRLLAACRESSNPALYDVVVLAISTGMRRNEILCLKAGQVDVRRGVIYLNDTKNGESRGVPLAGIACDLMRARLDALGDDADALVFPGTTGVTPFDIRKPWYWTLNRAGLRDLRFTIFAIPPHHSWRRAVPHFPRSGPSSATNRRR